MFPFIDMHCDTLHLTADGGAQDAQSGDAGGSLHAAEGVGHFEDALGSGQSEEQADNDKSVNNYSQYHYYSLLSR